jgi:hypothetical protein
MKNIIIALLVIFFTASLIMNIEQKDRISKLEKRNPIVVFKNPPVIDTYTISAVVTRSKTMQFRGGMVDVQWLNLEEDQYGGKTMTPAEFNSKNLSIGDTLVLTTKW